MSKTMEISPIELLALKRLAVINGALAKSFSGQTAIEQTALTRVLVEVINRAEVDNEQHVVGDDHSTLHSEMTSEGGVIRLSKWPEGYVLWFHGEIVWRSWDNEPEKVTVTLSVDASEALASLSPIAHSGRRDLLSLASRLREYSTNPHHIDPMSGRFRNLIAEASDEFVRIAQCPDAAAIAKATASQA